MEKQTNPFELLLNDNIIAILLGNKELGWSEHDDDFKIHMPSISIEELEKISVRVGFEEENFSFELNIYTLIEHCIKTECVPDLLSYFFNKSRFADLLSNHDFTIEQANRIYEEIVWHAIYEINFILNFYNKKLVQSNGKYQIVSIDTSIIVDTPNIKATNREFILSLYENALKAISDKDYEGCLTKSRTLLEEVFYKVIEDKGEVPSDKGDIGKLYSQVKILYNMRSGGDVDKRINTLISGLEKIVVSVSEMRNKASDAHGVGAKRYNVLEYHARLALNSAATMAEFIYSVAENANKN